MDDIIRSVIFSLAVLLVWISCCQATAAIRDRNDCPGQGYDRYGYWSVDVKEGTRRCVLSCNGGYEPSGCHVLRPKDNGWNYPKPLCVEKPLVSKTMMVTAGVGVGAVVAAPLAVAAAGFGTAGVVAGSLAAFIQTPLTAVGSWFALSQSAGAVGLAAGTKLGIGSIASGLTYTVSSLWPGCEAE